MNKLLSQKLNIAHLISTSLPLLSGYSIRTHYLLKFQKKYVNPYAITEPNSIRSQSPHIIDNITYFHNNPNLFFDLIYKQQLSKKLRIVNVYDWFYNSVFDLTTSYLKNYFNLIKPNIIHIHSSPLFGKYGGNLAIKSNIPFIFEIRGFVEDTHVGLGNIKKGSLKYKKQQKERIEIAKKADALVTLGLNMKEELVRQGIEKDKIELVPNAVDVNLFHPIPPIRQLKEKFSKPEDFLIGYVGSVRRIEGIEVLIKALKFVKEAINNVKLLIIGPGNPIYYNDLKFLAKKLSLEKEVIFVGKVPNIEIPNYYSILDMCVIPRLDLRVNRLVTPLKPLEVMAMEKFLLVSNLPALKELVRPKISGDFFKAGNYENLADKILYYLNHPDQLESIAKKARNYVKLNYSWSKIILKYISLYEKLI